MSQEDSVNLRSKAIERAIICPGCGFAYAGKKGLTFASLLVSLSVILGLIFVSVQASTLSLVLLAVAGVVSILCWLFEFYYLNRTVVQHSSEFFIAKHFVATIATYYSLLLVTIVFFFLNFGSLKMRGTGMSSTYESGEWLIYHKRAGFDSIEASSLIIFKNSFESNWGHSGDIITSRILAESGDKLSVNDGFYIVNGEQRSEVALTGNYLVSLEVPTFPETISVPENSFFVVQDSGLDSQVLSWVHKDSIMGTNIWSISPHRFLEQIH